MLMLGEINWGPINGGVSLVLAISLFYIGSKAAKIDKLETELKKNSDDRISTQMQLIRAEMQIPMSELRGLVAQIKERMGDGDDHFEAVDEKNHKLELKTQMMIGELRTYMAQNLATKEDFTNLNQRLTHCQTQRKC